MISTILRGFIGYFSRKGRRGEEGRIYHGVQEEYHGVTRSFTKEDKEGNSYFFPLPLPLRVLRGTPNSLRGKYSSLLYEG
jgi:hypothetical protein